MNGKCYKDLINPNVLTWDEMVERFGGGIPAKLVVSLPGTSWREVPCVLAKDPADATETEKQEQFIFSPFRLSLTGRKIGIEELVIVLAAIKLSKTPEGLKTLQAIATKYLDTIGRILVALEGSSSSNWLTAIVNQKLSLRVLKNLGLLTPSEALHLESNYNYIFQTTILKEGIVEGLAAAGTLAKGVGALLPTPT